MTKRTKRLLAEFEEAVRADEMKGAQLPEHHDEIMRRLARLRARLEYHIGYLESLERKLL
jgi:hypothetical protein